MIINRNVTLVLSLRICSTGVVTLLEKLGADYRLHVLNMKVNEQRTAAYLAINPMDKVPAIDHNDAVAAEQVAVYLYPVNLYSQVSLALPIGGPLRGPYLRWMAIYGTCFEPALVDRSQQRHWQLCRPMATSTHCRTCYGRNWQSDLICWVSVSLQRTYRGVRRCHGC